MTGGPLPAATRVRKARRSSTVSCGHYVLVGHVIVRRAGRWMCIECALDSGTIQPATEMRSPWPS
jgi:hypothetical protein